MSPSRLDGAPTTGKTATEGEKSPDGATPAEAVELVQRYRCCHCEPPNEFSSKVPACPNCGTDGRNPTGRYIFLLVTTHFDPPHEVLLGYGPGPFARTGRGQGIMACTGRNWPAGTIVSGSTDVVNCPLCRANDAFKDAERKQHPPDATEQARTRVDEQVSRIRVVPHPGLDAELEKVFAAIATGIRECSRLMESVPHLWGDESEYRRLAQCVADAATAARTASSGVDLRLRRSGGPNPVRDALNDILTVQDRAPLDPSGTPGGLNAILTNLHMKREGLFQRVDGQGCIDRMLDQLGRVPPVTNTASVPPSAVDTPAGKKQTEREKPAADGRPTDGPFRLSSTRFGLRWENRERAFDSSETQSFEIISAMWPPVQGKQSAVADVQKIVGSKATHPKWATNVASTASEVLGRHRIPFKLIGNNKDGFLQWEEVSDGTS